MNNFDKENQFKNYIAYYDELKDTQNKNNYIDSLKNHNQNLISENIDASFNINESFLENSRILEVETKKNFLNRNWIAFLVTLLVVGVVFVFVKYKSLKRVLKDFSKRRREYSLIENNHDKLKLKVKGLENYIVDLKKEIKSISSITNIDDQRNKIKSLHKDIHHSSSVLLVKGEDHLDLINNLNAEFFNQMSIKHPELNPSEVIICYYLFMGFKTKEISVFLNTSVRSVESKRYRITNKLGIKKEDFKLVDYLKETFKDTTSFSS
jgi:DNA-binding CsgD family transcriptional regulator